MKIIDADALKKYKFTTQIANGVEIQDIEVVPIASIDNAPPVELRVLIMARGSNGVVFLRNWYEEERSDEG